MKLHQRVVSLGGNCMITKELRAYFGTESANLFDWWITPADALVRLIESDFEDLFAAENLRVVGDRESVANVRYGNLHHHDFPRDNHERVIAITGKQLERNREKFAYLKRRWDDLAENPGPVVFVRFGWNLPAPLLEGIPPEPIEAGPLRLVAALDRKFPRLDYQILLIGAMIGGWPVMVRHPKLSLRESRIFTEEGEFLRAEDLTWKDNATIFSRIFSTVRLR